MVNIFIEGNIGAGKTTLLRLIESRFNGRVNCVPESVSLWTNFKGVNILEYYYNDKRWSYVFQLLTLYTLIKNYRDNRCNKLNVFERSIHGWKIFIDANAYLNKDQSLALNIIYTFLMNIKIMHIDCIIHLKCRPITSYNRIMKRNRPEEKNITIQYLHKLNILHSIMFKKENSSMILEYSVESEDSLINLFRNVI